MNLRFRSADVSPLGRATAKGMRLQFGTLVSADPEAG